MILFLLSISSAQAQIGWTIDQCRKHFGHELWIDSGGVTFGIKYRHYTPQENVGKRDAPAFSYDGRLITVTFDSDGTVGKIIWKRSGDFSDREIAQLLKSASAVSWRAVPNSPPSDCDSERRSATTQWVGEQHGVILFDAYEECNPFDGGHDSLTITTR
jgi:hypothetical protein